MKTDNSETGSKSEGYIRLKRDSKAIQIPSGETTILPEGTQVCITQALGGSYTVRTDLGYLMRIDPADVDALGIEDYKVEAPVKEKTEEKKADDLVEPKSSETLEEQIWDKMRLCYDPEIPVNVVDLGLIYDVKIQPHESGKTAVFIRMTLTAPGCPMADVLKNDVETKVESLDDVAGVGVDIVFDPPWNPGMMSEAARLQLGMF